MDYLQLDQPIDTIVEFNNKIVAGSYNYDSEMQQRSGFLYIIDPIKNIVTDKIPTSGTLSLFSTKYKLYAANVKEIQIYDCNCKLISQYATKPLNTYVFVNNYIYVTNVDGELLIFDLKLQLLKTVKISKESIWIVKEIGCFIYIGTETGFLYKLNVNNIKNKDECEDKLVQIGEKREGIIEIFDQNKSILISSYDDHTEVISKENSNKIKTGSLWKILHYNGYFYCAAMYEGLKIFDNDLNMIKTIKTDSICYGILIENNYIYFSSFYENRIYYCSINNLFTG
ncbi:hypothetical protein NUSPORA_00125 [Nucleospora cyclopteri]